MKMKDTLIASSVTTNPSRLARNLYTSNARFVFELLQNAEDNHYAQALGCGEVPEVSFGVYPDHVVVECNEDGFTAENLAAICNVGKSSKTGAQGYIGEKGIGFKSVFMTAYRAHIQSGHFSFFFQHRTGDSGMGMIMPVWEDEGKSLGACRTRITLLLHDDGTDAERAKARGEIRQQFLEIHDTILLFMKKLQRIKIALYGDDEDDEDEPETEITYSIDRQTDTRVAVTKSTCEHGETRQQVKYYHTTRHVATSLPKNEHRTYSAAEEASGAYKRGEVVLAFPLTAVSVPVLENYCDQLRVVSLAAGIAEAFVRGVLQMCDHETLQYSSRAHTALELDRHGAPLFRDVEPEIYLSLHYKQADLDRLQPFGLTKVCMEHDIERAKHDLASASSRFKSPATDEDWHSRAARLLHLPFRNNWAQRCKEAPPPFGAAAAPADVYFPQVALTDLAIPLDLALNVISLEAAANADRRKLFDALGAKTASANLVRDAIVRRHKDRRHPVALARAVQHVRFLYLTEHLVAKPMSADDTRAIRLFTHRGTPTDPAAAAAAAADVVPPPPAQAQAQAQRPPPVNDDINDNMSWTDWLAARFSVQRHVPIADSDGVVLSAACRYVAAHRPDKFVGVLREGWEGAYGKMISGEAEAMARELRAVSVPCRSGDVTGLRPLGEAFLPLADLVALGDQFLRRGDFFPWLALDAPLSHGTRPLEWEALGAEFGLGFERDLVGFGLAVLRRVVESNPKQTAMVEQQRVLELYEYLDAKVGESGSPEPCRERIRKAMRLEPCILYPLADGTHEWTKLEDCVWEAPVYLWEKCSLQNAYADTWKHTRAPNDLASLAGFFTRTLGVPDCTREHLVDEVRHVARVYKTEAKLDHMRKLYKCLADTVAGDSSAAANMRDIFHAEALICVLAADSDSVVSWHSAAECLWSSATPIRGMHVLDALYDGAHGLKAFFTDMLGVGTVTAELVYGKLAGEQELPAAEAKEVLLVFSAFLAARRDRGAAFAPGLVVDNAVFPVRLPGGRLRLARGTDAFVLLDRRNLGEDFAPLAAVLDCTMDEVEKVEEAEAVEVVSPPRTPTPRRQRSDSSSTASSGSETLVDVETPPSSVDSRASGPSAPRPQLFRQPGIATQRGAVPVANASQAAAQRASPSRPQPVAAAPHEAEPDAIVAGPDSDYLALLHQVVAAARRTTFPSGGAFDMPGVQAALLDVAGEEAGGGAADRYRLRSTSQLERDKRIGAAGELFVFELLSRLRLPGFSRANWQSTIRSYAAAHPEFADLAPWTGRETADITYADADGSLARLLVGAGYLDARVWAGVKGLQCFVEVKATTGPCNTPFYMSKGQYKRMQNVSNNNANDRQTDALYVVFRVFNLGADAVGLRVLVDPESMRQRGELAFAAELWSVVAA
ncbi:hypothetical protein B0T26DRAFT_679718 [Lasiosphaeria miniovina]|uniref:Protein NO VEIN C-terminal domain-containing protein n=1 Tax=Lasiosphaeria miniovina TaxID=1954250 RepID=A0AA39ZYG7_9PEZI|nr:uncharacterized protein B0T26DRAFT_679718 [Lasiosphaeria miniovina]KAK0705957.1 hypothetical protein B0T26DRAFT_679718 [Lasiosphaeria miniovina]